MIMKSDIALFEQLRYSLPAVYNVDITNVPDKIAGLAVTDDKVVVRDNNGVEIGHGSVVFVDCRWFVRITLTKGFRGIASTYGYENSSDEIEVPLFDLEDEINAHLCLK